MHLKLINLRKISTYDSVKSLQDSVETKSSPNPVDLVETRNRNRMFGRALIFREKLMKKEALSKKSTVEPRFCQPSILSTPRFCQLFQNLRFFTT